MKVLVLGNSYAAALRASVEHAREHVAFAGGSGDILKDVEFDRDEIFLGGDSAASEPQRKLWQITTGGASHVALAEFDAFIVVGIIRPVNPWAMFNCEQPGHDIKGLLQSAPISFGAYKAACEHRWAIKEALRLQNGIRAASPARRVIYLQNPTVRADAAEFDPKYHPPAAWSSLSSQAKVAIERNATALFQRFHAEHGIQVLHSPEELVVDGYRCPERYSVGALGSKNFEPGHTPQWGDKPNADGMNYTHKNADYGRVLWAHIRTALYETS